MSATSDTPEETYIEDVEIWELDDYYDYYGFADDAEIADYDDSGYIEDLEPDYEDYK